MDNVKIAAGCVAAVAVGLGIWCLADDEAPIAKNMIGGSALDYKGLHTLDTLLKICDELELEFICVYTRVYNMMLKFKENGTWQDAMIP